MISRTVECWSGRTFGFEPEKTALLVIDMQRHFLEDTDPVAEAAAAAGETGSDAASSGETQLTEVPEPEDSMAPEDLITNVAQLLAWARSLGCRVYHTREGYSPDMSDVSDFRRDLGYVGYPGSLGRSLIRGEAGHDFVAELQPLPGEPVIDKASFGAFYRTDLDDQLRAAGVERLILCGVTTQCCVHSTLREAVDRGYWCLTVADCCAASDPALHDAALLLIAGEGHLFGWITERAALEAAAPAVLS